MEQIKLGGVTRLVAKDRQGVWSPQNFILEKLRELAKRRKTFAKAPISPELLGGD